VQVEDFTWVGYALKAIYDRDAKGFVEVAKPLQEFSSSAQPILKWLNKPEAPLILQGEGRYVKLIIDIDESVMNEVLNQNYTYVCLNVTFWSSSFTPEPIVLFTVNYTYTPETFVQPILVEACRPTEEGWEADSSVHVKAEFTPATNVTTRDIYSEWFKNQTNDETALKMALKDIYETGPQIFSGFGAVDGELLKTSPLLYNLTVTAESYGRAAEVRRVVYMSFGENDSYKIYVNLLGGGVDVKVIDDSG